MADKYSWINGVLDNAFLQLKTTDGIYLKDLLEQEIAPLIEAYNEEQTTLERLLCYRFSDKEANRKKLFTKSVMKRISGLEQPGSNKTMDSWNTPMPIVRYGNGTGINMEVLKQMDSRQIVNWSADILVADKKLLIKQAFKAMLVKAPTAEVDELTHLAAAPKAFWNDENGMDTPRPNGQITFDGDHLHYKPYNGIGASGANLIELCSLVEEHEGMDGQGILWAQNGATVNLIKADTANFHEIKLVSGLLGTPNPQYAQAGVVQALVSGVVRLGFNVKIEGTWKNAIVISTPDIPANYIAYTMHVAENSELAPLGWREHPAFPGLILWSDSGSNPIIGVDAQYRRYLGMWVRNRDAGAVMFNTAGGTWTEPTFSDN